jgi:hypothetical protein
VPGSRWVSDKELAEQLRKLVSYGVTTDKLLKMRKILDLPNVRARAGENARDRELAHAAEALINDAVRTFRHTPEARGFRLLLVLDAQAQRYTAARRREEAIKALGARVRPDTWRTEEKWELAFLQRLARRIMELPPEGLGVDSQPLVFDGRIRVVDLASISRRELASETRDAIKIELGDDPRDDYEQLYARIALRFLLGRVPAYSEGERVLRAKRNQVNLWWEGINYTVSNDCVELIILDGTATILRGLPGNFHGFTYYELQFPRPLNEDDIHVLRLRKVITDRHSEPMPFFFHMARRSYIRVTVRVEFAPDCLPTKVYRIVTPTTRIPKGIISEQEVPIQADDSVESVFTDLTEGLSYGFRWLW